MDVTQVVESLLFATDRALTAKAISQIIHETAREGSGEALGSSKFSVEQVEKAIHELAARLEQSQSSIMVQAVFGGYLLKTRPEYAAWIGRLFDQPKSSRLSQPALETLAVIAYRQPISRAEVEKVRGVAVDGVTSTLLERRLIRQAGRSDLPGKALLYETTPLFLELFGLKNLDELPNAAELRRQPAQSPPSHDTELIQPELDAATGVAAAAPEGGPN